MAGLEHVPVTLKIQIALRPVKIFGKHAKERNSIVPYNPFKKILNETGFSFRVLNKF